MKGWLSCSEGLINTEINEYLCLGINFFFKSIHYKNGYSVQGWSFLGLEDFQSDPIKISRADKVEGVAENVFKMYI